VVDRTGEQIGNYRLVKLIGSGGFADVYLGQQIYLDSPAAIKLLHASLAQEEWESFRAEARTLVNLVHPHIIRLLDFGREGNTPFLVMDYAPKGTLRKRIQRGERLPLATVVDYTNQAASALQYAHNNKVIHRDVKPENMLIGRNDEILLTDFGIAVVAQSTRTQFTQETVGTIAYMAPEQIQSHPRAASDQYSLGVIVYEWITGNRPFNGSFTELAVKHMMVPPPPLRETVPDLAPEVEQVVMTALAKDPRQRFGSVQAFATALEHAAREALAVADQATILPQPQETPPAQRTQVTPPPQPPRQPQQAQEAPHLPIVLANPDPVTPVLPIVPPDNPPSNPGAMRPAPPPEAARALNTPDSFRVPGRSGEEDNQATVLVTPDRQAPFQPPQRPSFPPPQQRSTSQPGTTTSAPARNRMSRRAFLIGGLVTAGVVIVGGVTLYALEGHNTALTSSTGTTGTPPKATTTRATGPTIIAQDDFQRANQQGWGTASDGKNQWMLEAATMSNFSIVNHTGLIQVPQGGNGGEQTAILGGALSDGEVIVTGTASNFNNDNQLGVALRWTDDSHYYKAYLTGNTFSLIKRFNATTPISKSIPFTTSPNVPYTIRFRIVGNTMEARAWQSGQNEPTGWMLTATDNNQPFTSGHGGIRTNVIAGAMVAIASFELRTASSL
jgi:serine/threonine protein kinase